MHYSPMAPTLPTDLTRLRRQFHALSDETRLRLIDLLRNGECCVCELTDELGAGQSLLSFHLKALKNAGLVTDRREGRWSYYALNAEAFEQLEAFVGGLPSTKLTVLASRCCG
jgi:ArsR family transcriptional regulator, arsenate/arsenite/antimonite-responsive transcriptional repressor